MELCTDTLNHLLSDLPVYRLDNRADEEAVRLLAAEIDRNLMKYFVRYIQRIIRRIREGRLQELIAQWTWMAHYIRRYWLLIGGYTLLNMTGSALGLLTTMASRSLVDSVTGHNSGMLGFAAAAYVGVGVGQIFITAIRSRVSLKINLHITNGIRLDIFDQVIQTDWEALSEYRPGDLQYRLNGDVMVVINNILTFIPSLASMLVSFGGAFVVMVQNDPAMAVIALCGAPISLLVSRYNILKMRNTSAKARSLPAKTSRSIRKFSRICRRSRRSASWIPSPTATKSSRRNRCASSLTATSTSSSATS